MHIHDSRLHRTVDNTDTPCIPSAPTILTATATSNTTSENSPALPDFSCPHCTRNFTSRIGLVGHLRIHRTDAGELVLGAPTCHRHARLHYLYGTPTQLGSKPPISCVVVFLFGVGPQCVGLHPFPSPVFLTLPQNRVQVEEWEME
ncbi:unnamed protein product [Schistocephalus solidus]|uniref:C2H2-type domain-containing protein n=1 Tax=Schistocephalus solidus TaxID=70667 RepID=A0A183THR7_SCHSO|nr:unnamed protein product [Schistocephalus solidus]